MASFATTPAGWSELMQRRNEFERLVELYEDRLTHYGPSAAAMFRARLLAAWDALETERARLQAVVEASALWAAMGPVAWPTLRADQDLLDAWESAGKESRATMRAVLARAQP